MRKYLVDYFAAMVDEISAELTPQLKLAQDNIEGVFYMYAHPVEIAQRLSRKDGTDFTFKKYPLVCLFTDIEETKGDVNYYSRATITLLVVHSSSPDYISTERTELVFMPIIHPIVDALMEKIALNPLFEERDPDTMERYEIDHYYWGVAGAYGNSKNMFGDYLDATEIRLKVTINPNCVSLNGFKNI